MTGDDLEAIEAEMQAQNLYALSPEISGAFQSRLAARAAGVASDEIRHLPMKDYMKIKNSARDFFAVIKLGKIEDVPGFIRKQAFRLARLHTRPCPIGWA